MCTQGVMDVEHIGLRHLRNGLGGYVRRVRSGQSLLITDRGLPVARLSPVTAESERRALLEAEGLMEWSQGKPAGLTHPPQVRDGTVADLVIQGRR